MQALEKEQMILTWIADIIIESYLMDSALGRTLKLIERDGVEKHESAIDATRLYINDAMARVEAAAKNALAATVDLCDSHTAGGQGRGGGRLYFLIDEGRFVRCDRVNQTLCFLSRNNGRNTNSAGISASPPYRGGAFGGGSVRVREPRPEPMRRGVDQWKSGG
jgi:hypothetical protein